MVIFYAWLLYPFATLTWWWYSLILLPVLTYWLYSCHDYPTHFDMYAHIIVYLVCLSVVSLACILSWLFFLACYLCCYSFWLSYSRLAYVWTWVIYLYFSWLLGAWLLFFCVFSRCLSMWITYLSLYLQPYGFGHFLFFRFLHLQVWGLVCDCFFDWARG